MLAPVDVVSVHYCHQVGPASPSRSTLLFRANIRLVRVLKRLSERLCFAVNSAATFACVSEGVAQEVREHYPAIAARVITIHNGVDTERFSPAAQQGESERLRAQLGLERGQLVAAFVGGEWERKGLRAAIEALAEAPGWTLVVAGEGDQSSYMELAESRGVAGAVRWLGVRRDVAAVYAMADVFVMPTSYETFSLVTFEAAASGLPILATAVNGISELLQDGVNGFLIRRDARDIAGRLRELAADAQLRDAMGAAARRSAARFSWQDTVAKHHDMYQRIGALKRTRDCVRR